MDEEHQVILGVSVSNLEADLQRGLQRNGVDIADPLMMGAATMLTFAYNSVPNPPVSPDAPLASAVAARAPADGVDRISLLPDALLRNVVSRLPAKDAARTAALATRWRGLWRSVPLAIVDAHILPRWISADRMMPGGEDVLSRAVAVAASRVLDAHPGPFHCVHLSRCHMASHQAEIERWLELLGAKGVQELVFINRPWPLDHPLPRTLFGCTAVTRLHLGLCRIPRTAGLPRTTRFPHLQMSPSTMVPSIKILALEVGFEVRNEVKMSRNDAPSGKVDPKFWKEAGCIDCVQRHVKRFVFQEFRGKRSELAFLKFIVERAQVLEKIVLMVSSKSFSSVDGVNAKLKPLTSAIWANKDCKLIVFKSPSSYGTSPLWACQIASNFSCRDPFDLLTFNAELYSGASVLQYFSAL